MGDPAVSKDGGTFVTKINVGTLFSINRTTSGRQKISNYDQPGVGYFIPKGVISHSRRGDRRLCTTNNGISRLTLTDGKIFNGTFL